jgi:PAS domain S-box-containing protein
MTSHAHARRIADVHMDAGDALADVVDGLPEAVIVQDAAGGVRIWNAAAERLYGWNRDEAVGRNLNLLLQTRHSFGVERIEREAAEAGSWTGEIYRRARDGREICVRVDWRTRRDETGAPAGLVERGIDATGLSDREQAAEVTAHRYRNLFNSMAASFWELDFSEVRRRIGGLVQSGVTDLAAHFRDHPEFIDDCIAVTGIVDINDTTVEMFGAPSREAITDVPMGWEWPPESRHVYAAALIAAAQRRERFITQCKLQRWDGSLLDALFTVCWPKGHEAQGTVLVGVIDLSDQVRAFEAMAHSEARFRNLFERAPIALCTLENQAQMDHLAELRRSGVEDLHGYFVERPDELRAMMKLISKGDANPEALRLLKGDTVADVQVTLDRFWQHSPETFDRAVLARLRGELSYSEETRITALDGSFFETLFTIAFSTGEPGSLNSITSFADITPVKEAMAALEISERRYKSLFDLMPVALAKLDMRPLQAWLQQLQETVPDLVHHLQEHPELVHDMLPLVSITDLNPEAARIFGAEGEVMTGTIEPFWQARPQTVLRSLLARLRGEQAYSEETTIVNLQGEQVDVLYTIAYRDELISQGQNVVGFVDLSERTKAHRALRMSETRYRDLFQQLPLALWRLDTRDMAKILGKLNAEGVTDLHQAFDADPGLVVRCMRGVRVLEVNAATMRLCGFSDPAEVVGRDVERFWAEDPTIFRNSLAARFRGEATFTEEGWITTPAGRVAISFGVSYPNSDDENGISVISTLDIRDRKQAEARVQQAQADLSHAARVSTLGELSASIAHEINQPLAAISTYAATAGRWLRRDTPDLDELRFLTGKIVEDAQRASDIILRIRRMAQNRMPDHVPLDLETVVREAMLLVRHELAGRSVRLEADIAPGLPGVMGDRVQLQQVFVNLILNAAQALGSGGAKRPLISISAEAAVEGVRLSFADNGPGIPEEHLGRLFDGFFTTKENGMGLGLPICRSIIEAHGGTIDGRNGRTGACFRIELPPAPALQ